MKDDWQHRSQPVHPTFHSPCHSALLSFPESTLRPPSSSELAPILLCLQTRAGTLTLSQVLSRSQPQVTTLWPLFPFQSKCTAAATIPRIRAFPRIQHPSQVPQELLLKVTNHLLAELSFPLLSPLCDEAPLPLGILP